MSENSSHHTSSPWAKEESQKCFIRPTEQKPNISHLQCDRNKRKEANPHNCETGHYGYFAR